MKSDEIAVSGKMTERFGLSIGSRTGADFPIYDTTKTYEVKAVLSYLSDLYDTQGNQDFAFAIVGYDEDLYNHSQGHVVYLLNDEQYGKYMEKDYSYSERYSIADEVSAIKSRIALYYVLLVALLFLVVSALALYLHKGINTEADKYYRDGFNASSVKSINRNDHIVFIGVPFLMEMIWFVLYQIRVGRQISYLLPVTGAMLITFICLYQEEEDMAEQIKFENLTVRLKNRILYENLNFTISDGDRYIFLGPNGIGKSLLLELIFLGNSRELWFMISKIDPFNSDLTDPMTASQLMKQVTLTATFHANNRKNDF